MYALVVQLLEPYTLLFLGLVAATVCAWRRPPPRSRSLKAATILLGLLGLISMPLAGYVAQGSLEWSYPPGKVDASSDDTLVVLAGGLVVDDSEGTQYRLSDSTLQRCVWALRAYRDAGGCRMVLCGGKVDQTTPGPTLAAAMRDFLVEAGVRPDDLILEDKSRTTYENALFCKERIGGENAPEGRIWLVTEAIHMRRAERCFRARGIDVVSAPCDHHAWREDFTAASVIPSARGISRVTTAAHEWLGILWYWLRGRM
jgi:uncharacterized SAM-binding protein YcdF (DUF218 family)